MTGCNNTCTTDADCGVGKGAQKCCEVEAKCLGSKQCVDPVVPEECVYLGVSNRITRILSSNIIK